MLAFITGSIITAACSQSARDIDEAADAFIAASEKLAQGLAGEGTNALRALSAKHPWFAVAQLELGRAEDARHSWLWAYVAYKRYLVAAPSTPDRAAIAARLLELEEKVPALKDFGDGERAAAAGDWRAAITAFEASIAKKPAFTLPYLALADAKVRLGDNTGAKIAYAAYLELDQDAPDRKECTAILERLRREK